MVTRTAQGIPGDALNVGLVGSREDVVRAMHDAGWFPADPITLKSSIEIIGSVLLDRSYQTAPVSPLYYQGRKQDLAFEKPSGTSADRRHHVRFWLALERGEEGRPVWLGSRHLRSRRGPQSLYRRGHASHRARYRCRARRPHGRPRESAHGRGDSIRSPASARRSTAATARATAITPTAKSILRGWCQDGRKTSAPPQVLSSPALVQFKDQLWAATKNALPMST